MKKTIIAVLLVLALGLSANAFAANVSTAFGDNPASGQVSCGATATLLYTTTPYGSPTPYGRLSITFENFSSTPVYISPNPSITTSNAGILLGIQYQAVTLDRASGNVSWYCITGGGTATVGYTEAK